jgi:hypothetical protein
MPSGVVMLAGLALPSTTPLIAAARRALEPSACRRGGSPGPE